MTSPSDRHEPEIDVRDAARLARISLPEEEVRILAAELSRIRKFLSILRNVDTEDIPPLLHLHEACAPARDDVADASLTLEDALRNAADRSGSYMRVPRVL